MRKILNGFLTGNQLKIIAMLAMTFDHIGVQILTENELLRIIGRLAFPIFAYMIAEGSQYTRNRKRYLITLAGIGMLCQTVYFFVSESLYQCIFVTFSLSVLLIYAIDNAKEKKNALNIIFLILAMIFVYVVAEILPDVLKNTDFEIDYGLWGIMLPVFVYLGSDKMKKLLLFIVGVSMVAAYYGGIQWFSLFSVLLIACYNEKRGKVNMKYLFYIYYPLHLAVIYGVSTFI